MRKITFKPISTWSKKQSKVLIGVVAGLVVGGLSSAAVLASIPDANGVIHGCIRLNGDLRIIDSATQTCTGQQTPLNFNQTGPQGPAGPQGPQGPAGDSGPGALLDNLVGADFTSASLQYRDFAGVDLHDAIFTQAVLKGSDFSGANLSNIVIDAGNGVVTDLSNVNFAGANFTNADLLNTHINGSATKIGNANFQGANFTGATFKGLLKGVGSDFRSAVFSSTVFQSLTMDDGADFSGHNFNGVTFVGDVGLKGNLSNTNFSGRTLTNFFIYDSDLTNANFSNGTFNNVQMGNDIANGTDFSGTSFVDSYFFGTNLTNANLAGVTWNNTLCPDATNSNDNGNTCMGHLVP